jgi:hypothetical protein
MGRLRQVSNEVLLGGVDVAGVVPKLNKNNTHIYDRYVKYLTNVMGRVATRRNI